MPPEILLDDVYIPMQVVRAGKRVIFEPRARVWDVPHQGRHREFSRKVRTLSGNYQLLQLAPWLLSRANPIRFEFISHKLVRLIVPFALVAAFRDMDSPRPVLIAAFRTQLGFYGLSLLGWTRWRLGPLSRLSDAAYTFVALNTAALVAFVNFVTGHKTVWVQPALRSEIKA